MVRGKNMAFNGYFDIEAANAEFPMGWVPVNGDQGTRWEWSTEYPVLGQHTVKVRNTSYTRSMVGIVQDQCYAIPVRAGEAWELSAWMKTEQPGVPLRLIAVFMDDTLRYLSEYHLKFTSTTQMQRYGGLVVIPPGVSRLKVACGVHDSPETLPSVLWISWVSLRHIEDSSSGEDRK
ncbi:MAG: hypothetical protein AB1446_01275 [Bacillota bacterium]